MYISIDSAAVPLIYFHLTLQCFIGKKLKTLRETAWSLEERVAHHHDGLIQTLALKMNKAPVKERSNAQSEREGTLRFQISKAVQITGKRLARTTLESVGKLEAAILMRRQAQLGWRARKWRIPSVSFVRNGTCLHKINTVPRRADGDMLCRKIY